VPPVLLGQAPTDALGNVLGGSGYMPSWGVLAADDLETNDKLVFPQSIASYTAMGSDSQVQGLKLGTTWPIFRMRWYIDPGNADADRVERMSRDYGLPIADDDMPPRKTRNRFKFLEHLEQALEAVFLGFQVFEQQYRYDDPADGGDGWLHVRKLLSLPPASIAEIRQETDGGLAWIKQQGANAPEISIERLVWYAFQKRGANWLGKSLLRGCYGPWLLKDRAIRVGVMNIQRAGVGTPVIQAPPGATPAELIVFNRLAERFKAGERSGGALPSGAKLELVGITGGQPDTVGFIKLMNEEMARAFLQMFIMAGQTGEGTRSTAQVHLDWHKLTLEYIANWAMTIFNEHQMEDHWELNYGEEDEDICAIRWEWDEEGVQGQEAAQAAAEPLSQLRQSIEQGQVAAPPDVAAAIGADPDRAAHASRHGAPRARRRRSQTRSGGARVSAAASPPLPLPTRALRRQLYDHEINAAVDYAAIETSYDSALDLLVQEVRTLQGYQIADLHDSIVDAGGDMATLAALKVDPEHRDTILLRLRSVAEIAANLHVEEARRQGRTLPRPDIEEIESSIAARAEAVDLILSGDLAQSASRNAVRLSGGSLSAAEVAEEVRNDLVGRSDKYLRDILGGAVMQAINDGRGLVMRRAEPQYLYASELLDGNTCVNCVARDGTPYQNMDDAARDYPSGGYKNCLGRERCRGMLVAVYNETEATT
jgi:hypothetical protein